MCLCTPQAQRRAEQAAKQAALDAEDAARRAAQHAKHAEYQARANAQAEARFTALVAQATAARAAQQAAEQSSARLLAAAHAAGPLLTVQVLVDTLWRDATTEHVDGRSHTEYPFVVLHVFDDGSSRGGAGTSVELMPSQVLALTDAKFQWASERILLMDAMDALEARQREGEQARLERGRQQQLIHAEGSWVMGEWGLLVEDQVVAPHVVTAVFAEIPQYAIEVRFRLWSVGRFSSSFFFFCLSKDTPLAAHDLTCQ